MPFTSKPVELTPEQKTELTMYSNSTKAEYRMVFRSKIILLLSQGKTYNKIAEELSTSRFVIAKWKRRFIARGIDGLKDLAGRGKEPNYTEYDKARVINLACSKPEDGCQRWTQKRIAEKLGMSQSTVNRILKSNKLKPHKTEYWCGKSTDPEFESKMLDIVGLYLDPPDNALVLSVDEKTQIQALERTQPELPMVPGKPRRLTNTYKRHGTVSLIAALSIHSGDITAKTIDKNNAENFIKFLKKLDRENRNKHLHIIVDNLKVHSSKKVKQWLSHKRKITIHYTPTYSSWLNMIEIWFSILARDLLKDAVWHSKKQLVDQLMTYIKMYKEKRAKPFVWTYKPRNHDS